MNFGKFFDRFERGLEELPPPFDAIVFFIALMSTLIAIALCILFVGSILYHTNLLWLIPVGILYLFYYVWKIGKEKEEEEEEN